MGVCVFVCTSVSIEFIEWGIVVLFIDIALDRLIIKNKNIPPGLGVQAIK